MILHLIETGGPGGAEQMLLRLTDEYARRGISQIVCLRKDGWLAAEVRQRGLPLEIIPLNRLPDTAWFVKLRHLIRIREVTAIHAHEFAMNIRAAILGKLLSVAVVATVHGKGYFGDKWVRRQAYRFTSRLAILVVVSEDIRQYLISRCGVKPTRVNVIPNGVDVSRFCFDQVKRKENRKQLGIDETQLLLGTIGSYYPVKGHYYLINAMKRLVNINRNVKLVMAGQGPLEHDLRKQVVDLGLCENVDIIGYVIDTPKFLSALDIFVMPSLSEGLPLALLEAAANSRCIVATNVGGIPEIIEHQDSGVLVPPGDADSLFNALVGVLEPSTRFKMGQNAAAKVMAGWSIHHTAGCYLKFLLPDESARESTLH